MEGRFGLTLESKALSWFQTLEPEAKHRAMRSSKKDHESMQQDYVIHQPCLEDEKPSQGRLKEECFIAYKWA